ncbi:MAG: holo-[acyl-carrier-protein] synthase [Epulopiscium sp. Nuni2H_MBin003]|nr:MAG: holo-[acyl-carrier-protein] synthase [Epulopiscium sp. Nuni2H_MBin003]
MIIGVGTDIIEIERVKKAMQNTAFLTKLFTQNEREYCKTKAETVAGLFAAKEAVSKALGTGFRNIKMKEVEITHTKIGQPIVNLYENAKKQADSLNIDNINISISHCKTYAIAYVIVEKCD